MDQEPRKNNTVFYISLVIVLAIAVIGIALPDAFNAIATGIFNFLVNTFGWFYLIAMLAFVVISLGLAFSRYGTIKLGSDDDKPDFPYLTWFGMLFGAGMGIGLVFWGVAEPLNHYVAPPFGIASGTPEAAAFAFGTSFLHWGFHPWANYSIIGLALAYFQFRKNKPGLISTIFIPLIGEQKVNGPIGKTIDIFAIFATVAGVATSLGLGIMQINSGLNYVFGIPNTVVFQLISIAVITIIYIATAVSGIEKGIKYLSNINLVLAFSILGLVMLIGPGVKMLNAFTQGMGQYLNFFISDSLRIIAFGDNRWIGGWTIFYWAWWIAWAPFVGTFIARISRGRTIREFVIGVTFVPALASFAWFAAFGSLGINLGVEIAREAIQTTETALFVVLQHYPLGILVSIIALILLGTFFITSANTATFVLGMYSQQGDLNPSNTKKTLWGLVQAALATALLLAGGLRTLQIGSIAAAFPFTLIMLLASVSIYKALKAERDGIVKY